MSFRREVLIDRYCNMGLPLFPHEWEISSLDQLTSRVKVGFVGSCGKYYCDEHEGIPMIRTTDLTANGVSFENLQYVTKEFHKKNKKSQLKKGDILVARHGDNGKACLFDSNLEANCLNVVVIEPDSHKMIPKHIKYLFDSEIVKNQILFSLVGSVQNVVNTKTIANLVIPFPKLTEQKAITYFLSTIDEKIKVNKQINKILENMMQEIFKRWFVEFDFTNEAGEPYKSSGGEMFESELGLIPKRWKVGTISDFIESTLGGDWGKESVQGSYEREVYCIRGADIESLKKGEKGKAPKRYIIEKNYLKKKLEPGNLIIEISGGSPTQSTGRISYISEQVIERFEAPIICTNFCRAIKLKKREYMEFIFSYWAKLYEDNIFFNYENGTTGIKNLDINSFVDRHQIIIPEEYIILKFAKAVKSLQMVSQFMGSQNEKLEEVRDKLLPKLMSGEIRVPIDEM